MSRPYGQDIYGPRRDLISYDYFDISNGLGYDIYYGFSADGVTGVITRAIYSGMIHVNNAEVTLTDATTEYEMADIDFDLTFNLPRNIKGDIIIQVPFGINQTDGDPNEIWHISCDVLAYHYDGSTETQIGSTQTSEDPRLQLDTGEAGGHMTTVKINAPSVVHFKKGETLRITIKVKAECNNAGRKAIGGVCCDPQNRSDFAITLKTDDYRGVQIMETVKPTRMEFHIPFVIDV